MMMMMIPSELLEFQIRTMRQQLGNYVTPCYNFNNFNSKFEQCDNNYVTLLVITLTILINVLLNYLPLEL